MQIGSQAPIDLYKDVGAAQSPTDSSEPNLMAKLRELASGGGMVGLGAGIGAASVVYFDARIGSAALGIWWEELKQLIDYLAPKNLDGTCAVLGPEEWCADVGLLSY